MDAFVERAQYFSKRWLAGMTPYIKGLAINPVYEQKGSAVLADAAVKKARNARMAELRQRLAFVLQKAGQVVALAADQLEGRLHFESPIGTLGPVDLAHAAGRNQLGDAPAAQAFTGRKTMVAACMPDR